VKVGATRRDRTEGLGQRCQTARPKAPVEHEQRNGADEKEPDVAERLPGGASTDAASHVC